MGASTNMSRFLLLAAGLAAAACMPNTAAGKTISISWSKSCSASKGKYCSTASKTITEGDTVTWSASNHNVLSSTVKKPRTRGSNMNGVNFDSGWMSGSYTKFSFTFDKAGTYPYYCSPHSNMNARIIVLPKPTAKPTTTPAPTPPPTTTTIATTVPQTGQGKDHPIAWGFSCAVNSGSYCDEASVTISTCDTVTWTATDHNVMSSTKETPRTHNSGDASSFDSGWLTVGKNTFTVKFNEAGEYPYYCSPHDTMNAKITVIGAPCADENTAATVSTSNPNTPAATEAATTAPRVELAAAKYTVVGAGPGGTLAAHILSQAASGETRLLERGGMPNPGTYTLAFAYNYNTQPTFLAGNYNGDDFGLAQVFGGQQTTNGGVYSPGTAKDLAAALGVSEQAAASAQACASASIDWTPEPARPKLPAGIVPNIKGQTLGSDKHHRYGYLAECASATGATESCAWGDMLFGATEIKRRTVAQKLHGNNAAPAYATLNTTVKRIIFADPSADELVATALEFDDGVIAPVAAGGAVVLAAGAIGTNGILARSDSTRFGTFGGLHNHYYAVAYQGTMWNKTVAHMDQWFSEFTTAGSGSCAGQTFEVQMNGNYPVSNGLVQIVVLQMEPEMRGSGSYDAATGKLDIVSAPTACDTLARTQAKAVVKESWGVVQGRAFDSPSFDFGPWGQAWHWAGGVPLANGSRIAGMANVFSGDTSALRKPFSCHTSMPSAAAGVAAAMQALGKGKAMADCRAYVPQKTCLRQCERAPRKARGKRSISP